MLHLVFGFIGVTLLVVSGIPQLIRSVRLKNVIGLSPYSLCCVFLGCVCMTIHTILDEGMSIFHANYLVNGLISLINLVLYLKYRGK